MSSSASTSQPAAPGVWAPGRRGLTVSLLLVVSLTAFEAMAVATVMPAIAEDLGGAAALGWYGWVFSGFMLANLVGIPAAGRLADRGGPAWPFLLGSLLFAAGLLVAGAASSMPILVAARVAQGLGAGALSSVAYVAVARAYPAADQPRMLALLASAWVIPGLSGPAAAAALDHLLGWRSVFLALLPMTGVAVLLATPSLRRIGPPDKSKDATPPASMMDAMQLAAGVAVALAAAEAGHPLVVAACVVAGLAFATPALARLLPAGTLRAAAGAPAALAIKGLATFSFFGVETFLPLAMTTLRGQSIAMAGLALTAGTLAWVSGAWVQERLAQRVRPEAIVRWGLVSLGAAVVGAAAVLVAPHPTPVAVLSWTLAGLGIGAAYPATTLVVFQRTPKGDEGRSASALQLVNVLGVALGAGLGGVVLRTATRLGASEHVGVAAIDAVMLAGILLALLVTGQMARGKRAAKGASC